MLNSRLDVHFYFIVGLGLGCAGIDRNTGSLLEMENFVAQRAFIGLELHENSTSVFTRSSKVSLESGRI